MIKVMAFLEDKFVPTLTGESARRFLEEMERNDNMATHVLPDNFFDDGYRLANDLGSFFTLGLVLPESLMTEGRAGWVKRYRKVRGLFPFQHIFQ